MPKYVTNLKYYRKKKNGKMYGTIDTQGVAAFWIYPGEFWKKVAEKEKNGKNVYM
jgi:hypothetical protein